MASTVDVLVVGAGPCGITIANLLGLYGVSAIVIDRERDVLDFPRAVGIDDESLRTCQTIGLVDAVLADTLQDMSIKYFTSWGRCFAYVKPSNRPFGWPRRNLFLQPLLERTLRTGLRRFEQIELRLGCELVDIEQDDSGVTARVRTVDGSTESIRAAFAVGADGGRSTVRDLIGVALEGTTEATKWLVVDVANDRLDEQYSAVFCDPDSPILMVPLPYGHRRFEFRLRLDEDESAVVDHDHVRRLLAPRYGSTPLPDIVRARVYLHHSRVAQTFRRGRVLLAGDAAHLQPPFFGQGMNSGLRDATNLAWKLAAVARAVAGPEIVDSYDLERRPHAAAMVGFATRIGAMYRPRNRLTERFRDLVFRAVQRVPGGRDYILQMKFKPMPRYTHGVLTGVDPKNKADPIGRMFPQPRVRTVDGDVLLDDSLGSWFAVIGIGVDPTSGDADAVEWWRSVGARFVHVIASGGPSDDDVLRTVVDIDGAMATWCGADQHRQIVVLRPDRYCAATCSLAGFAAITADLRATFGTPI
jgi:3-(3-hydroxy-phenyl)propionate hydroxylase